MHPLLLEIPDRLDTERLFLRRFGPGDGAWYHGVAERSREHLARYESGNALMFIRDAATAEVTVRRFAVEWAARTAFFWAAFDKGTGPAAGGTGAPDGPFVGQVYVGPVDWELGTFDVGYVGDPAHGGRGYITEAVRGVLRVIFGPMQGTRAEIRCDDTNAPSARVAERCGFTREGHLRENHRAGDRPVSGDYVYGLLRREFVAQGGVPLPGHRDDVAAG